MYAWVWSSDKVVLLCKYYDDNLIQYRAEQRASAAHRKQPAFTATHLDVADPWRGKRRQQMCTNATFRWKDGLNSVVALSDLQL